MDDTFTKDLKNIDNPKEFKLLSDSVTNLTPKEENCCRHYFLCHGNKSEAYRKSFNCKNSTDKTVRENACKLFKTERMQTRLKELKEEINREFKYTVYESFTNLEFAQKIILGLDDKEDDFDDDGILRIFTEKKVPKPDVANFISAEEKKAKIMGLMNNADNNVSVSFKDIVIMSEETNQDFGGGQ
jgi:hypothetical protein